MLRIKERQTYRQKCEAQYSWVIIFFSYLWERYFVNKLYGVIREDNSWFIFKLGKELFSYILLGKVTLLGLDASYKIVLSFL